MSLQAGKSDEEERGETPSLIVKSLGRLAENTLLSAWITWQLTLAHNKGGANVVVWAALQRRIGSAFSRGETVVTLDKAVAQDSLEAFSKRVRDLTVEMVVIAFARLSDWVTLMLSLCLMLPLPLLPYTRLHGAPAMITTEPACDDMLIGGTIPNAQSMSRCA